MDVRTMAIVIMPRKQQAVTTGAQAQAQIQIQSPDPDARVQARAQTLA